MLKQEQKQLSLCYNYMSKKKSFKELIRSERPTLVDFYATWCGPCKMMHPVLKELASDVKGEAKILKVDIDKNQKLANKLGIRSVPTFIIYKSGKEMWRKSGGMSKGALANQIQKFA